MALVDGLAHLNNIGAVKVGSSSAELCANASERHTDAVHRACTEVMPSIRAGGIDLFLGLRFHSKRSPVSIVSRERPWGSMVHGGWVMGSRLDSGSLDSELAYGQVGQHCQTGGELMRSTAEPHT